MHSAWDCCEKGHKLTMQMKKFEEAKADCDVALELCYGGAAAVKILLRRGTAYVGLREPCNAVDDFLLVLQLEPGNRYTCQASQQLPCNAFKG